ncbi:hypothetical protein MAL08_20040 (plasmid) [Leptospira noguchii]|uniref:hypothetical protein n=1 Tax=Leptospira noguchii TaxID=28182 RepID=UPI001FB76A21|nr:hypothetical protein [Leptospira noguchii]UOG40035.1 hypothetical protein MAL08_20040 [Leptospira noguchii]
MKRKRTTQRLASMVARRVVSHFNYEICERFAPIFLRRTHVSLLEGPLRIIVMSCSISRL